jgi:hypothetical protein
VFCLEILFLSWLSKSRFSFSMMRDVANFPLHAFGIILLVLDGYRILVADRNDLGGYSDCSNDACCD